MDKVKPFYDVDSMADMYVTETLEELVQAVNELIEKVDRLNDLYKILYSTTKKDVRRTLSSTLTQAYEEIDSLDGSLSDIASIECELMNRLASQTTTSEDWSISDEDVQVQEVVHNKICQVIRGAMK